MESTQYNNGRAYITVARCLDGWKFLPCREGGIPILKYASSAHATIVEAEKKGREDAQLCGMAFVSYAQRIIGCPIKAARHEASILRKEAFILEGKYSARLANLNHRSARRLEDWAYQEEQKR